MAWVHVFAAERILFYPANSHADTNERSEEFLLQSALKTWIFFFLSPASLNTRKRYPAAPFFLFEDMDGDGEPHGDVRLDKSETKMINLLGRVPSQITEPCGCSPSGCCRAVCWTWQVRPGRGQGDKDQH